MNKFHFWEKSKIHLVHPGLTLVLVLIFCEYGRTNGPKDNVNIL